VSPLLSDSIVGTEDILDVIESAIILNVNDALISVYAKRVEADQQRAALRGEVYVPYEYEEVPANHVFTGNFPSAVLEEVGPEAYPYIAITPEDYIPDTEDAMQDHRDVYRSGITVHCLAKSEPQGDVNDTGVDYAADIVFRRAVRMSEAVFLVFHTDSSVMRLIAGASNPMRGQHSLPWTYQHHGVGPNFWFQAVGTSYVIKSYTSNYG
jgi:hypothetical protein